MMLTSVPATDRNARRTRWLVHGLWAVMLAQMIFFVWRYPHSGPIIDEWEFVPAVTGEEPVIPWLWKLHNEHRFPLPRLVWLPITQIAGDFRAGCWVSMIGVAGTSLLMTNLARRLRGRLHWADAFFPLSLMNVGHWENLRMGYQVVFMMNLLFACILLRLVLTTDRGNLLRRAWQTWLVTLLLCGCGAGGLAFAPFMLLWIVVLAFTAVRAGVVRWNDPRVLGLAGASLLIPLYVWFYMQGFHRPEHHEHPLDVWHTIPEVLRQAMRSALQALPMGFGPAVTGLWPVSGAIVGFVSFELLLKMVRLTATRTADRPRIIGLLLFFISMLGMAFAIGWGRCVFLTPEGEPGFMGMSCRYGWILWPALAVVYFLYLLYGSARQAKWVPIFLMLAVTAMLPFNVVTGIWYEGEPHREGYNAWEKAVRSGQSDEELREEFFPHYGGEMRRHFELGLMLLRQHRFQFYAPVDPPRRGRP